MTICIIISFKRKSYFSISKISGIIPTLVQLWNFGINQDCQSNPLCNVDDRVSFSFFSLNNRCSCSSVVVCRCLGNVCGFAGEGKRKGTSSLYHFYCKLPSLNSLWYKFCVHVFYVFDASARDAFRIGSPDSTGWKSHAKHKW